MKEKQDFCLTAQFVESDNGEARFVFDDPVSIKPNSEIVVYWANVQQQIPQTGYLARGFTIYVNLPVHTLQNVGNQDVSAYKRTVFLNIPPTTQADLSADDPGAGTPTVSSITYEPFNSRVLQMKNQEQQITSLEFQVVDLGTGEANATGVGIVSQMTVAFCIKECGDDKNMY